MNSVAAGVTPRTGIEHLAVGRKEEIGAIVTDLDNVGEGGAAFRVISGPFGSGKSFLLQLARNYALERNYVVMDADLSPERRWPVPNGRGSRPTASSRRIWPRRRGRTAARWQ